MYVFGAGNLYAVPATGSPAQPAQFGTLQDVSVAFSFTNKELYGQSQYPVAIGRGPAKVDCKATAASFFADALNGIFFGNTSSAGGLTSTTETSAIPGTPFAITVTNSAQFDADLGVVNAATGVPLKKVTSGPTTGQYSQSAGVYTFAAADTTLSVSISYSYTLASAGKSTIITNQPMGTSPRFAATLTNAAYGGQNLTLKLYSCLSMSLSMDFKNQDFTVPNFAFQAMANAAGQVGQLSLAE